MALSPQALIRGIVQRALGAPNADNPNVDVAPRMFTQAELGVMSVVRKAHVLADEGSYFITNNGQAGIAPTYATAFSATTPFIVITNNSQTGQRLYLDYISLTAIAAGACTTAVGYTAAAMHVDGVNRYTSGGSNISGNIVSPNMVSALGIGAAASVYCGAITAPAASAAVRQLVGIRNVRPGVSSTVINVVGDLILFNFGGVEGAVNGSITVANMSLVPVSMPPVVIGPGQSGILSLWYPVLTAPSAATYAPEVAFWMR